MFYQWCCIEGEVLKLLYDLDLIPGMGKSPGEGNGYPLQYSGLENSIDWIVHGIASRTFNEQEAVTVSPMLG